MATDTGTSGAVQTSGMFASTQVKVFYEMELLLRALPKFYHCSFMKEATIPRGGGDTLEWRKLSALPAAITPLSEGVTPAPEAMQWKTIQLTPKQYGAFLLHTDILEFVAIDPLQDQISRVLGEQAGLSADTLGRELMIASGTVQIVGQTQRQDITANDKLTETQIGKAWATLLNYNALPFDSIDGRFACIIHPFAWRDLWDEGTMRTAVQNALPRSEDHPMFTGEVYDYLGIRFFVTSQAKYLADAGSGSVDVYFTLIIGRDAFGIGGLGQTRPQMQLGMGGTGNPVMPVTIINKPLGYADELDLRASTGWKMTQEETELDPTFCVRIEHACSLGSN